MISIPAIWKKLGITGNRLTVVKRYTLAKATKDFDDGVEEAAYHLDFDIEFEFDGAQTFELAYRLNGATGLPLEGWWYAYKVHPTSFGGAGVRDVVGRKFGGNHIMKTNPKIVKSATKNPENPDEAVFDDRLVLRYAGVDAQYFASVLIADVPDWNDPGQAANNYRFERFVARAVEDVPADKKERKQKRNKTDVSFQIDSEPIRIDPGTKISRSFKIFIGPKRPELLSLTEYQIEDCISYGWFPMISKPLTGVLHFFYLIVRNYGISIILLTILVRGCLFPLGRQQAINAQRMQELAPEMKKIADKYKDDMQKRSEAQRELFRKNNYNPLSGCLPMFFQLPIFVGLYRALSVDIELRQAPLIPGISWCSNLSAPDQLLRWDSFMPEFLGGMNGMLGPYLNILPLISVALMIVHQKLFTPPPADEQQEMQMKMMKFMMIFFGFLFFRVPAGLCLYFITSSLWGLAERKLLPKPKPKQASPQADESNKKPSMVESLAETISGKQKPQPNGASRRAERKKKQKRR